MTLPWTEVDMPTYLGTETHCRQCGKEIPWTGRAIMDPWGRLCCGYDCYEIASDLDNDEPDLKE